MRWFLLLAVLLACNGGDETEEDTGRSSCEESCHQVELIPCRDNCDADCGSDDACRDRCHGDCISRYDSCVAENCE